MKCDSGSYMLPTATKKPLAQTESPDTAALGRDGEWTTRCLYASTSKRFYE